MILAFDVGNTNVVIGCIENGNIKNIIRTRTEHLATWEEWAIKITDFISFMKLPLEDIDGSIISSVVPSVQDALFEALKEMTGKEPKVVSKDNNGGLKVKIDDPNSLAGDLITGAVGAIEHYGFPCLIIDLGTATTITAVDNDGVFRGGAIIPGVRLSLSALSSGTSLLPEISITAPNKAIATNTVDCMKSGLVLGNASMIDGMIDRFYDELGQSCKVIATGGLASSIVKYCKHEIICDDNLLLKGLWVIYNKNNNMV